MAAQERDLEELVASASRGALVAIKRDGRPQLSNVSYTYDRGGRLLRVSSADGRAKVANLRRDPRGALYVTTPDLGAYAIAEGLAELTPPAADPGDATVDELVEVYRAIAGEHPDWEEYRAAMVSDRRLVIRLRVDRFYGARAW